MRFDPIIGANGRLYFNFGLGAEVVFRDVDGSEFTLKIVKCEYINGVEYYSIERNGLPQLGRITANRLMFIINHNQVKILSAGEPQELPLTVAEVTTFLAIERRQAAERRRIAEEKLKPTAYAELMARYKEYKVKKAMAEAYGHIEEAAHFEKLINEKRNEITALFKALKIAVRDLEEPKRCCYCNGTGVIGKNVCGCMRKRSEVIKTHCAKIRLGCIPV